MYLQPAYNKLMCKRDHCNLHTNLEIYWKFREYKRGNPTSFYCGIVIIICPKLGITTVSNSLSNEYIIFDSLEASFGCYFPTLYIFGSENY